MSDTLTRIQRLVGSGDVSVSVQGFRELTADDILLVERLCETKTMKRKHLELVRVDNHAVEVPVEVITDEGEGGWSPYFSLEDAKKLETVRLALQRSDLAEAAKHGRLFELLPVSA